MNKEIDYEMIVIGKSISPHAFNTACSKYKNLSDSDNNNKLTVLAIHFGNVCSVSLKQNGKDSNLFSFPVPNELVNETDLLTLITDDVELSIKSLFDKGTLFNLETLYYYND